MSVTYSLSSSILDEYFGKITPTIPSTYYMGLSTTPIQPDGTGITEPTDTAYTRIAIPNNKTSFTNTDNGSLSNAIQFQFPEAQVSWGVITHFFFADAVTGGNVKIYGQLTNSRTVEIGTTLILAAGALQINLQNIV